MGAIDRIIRFIIALGIAVLYFLGLVSGTAAIILGIVAILFLITSYFGVCPAYIPLGIKTFKASKE